MSCEIQQFNTKDLSLFFGISVTTALKVMKEKMTYSVITNTGTRPVFLVDSKEVERHREFIEKRYKTNYKIVFVSDLAYELNYSVSNVYREVVNHNLKQYKLFHPKYSSLYKVGTNKWRPEAAINQDDADFIRDFFGAKKEKAVCADSPFTSLSWFPDVVPECFKNMPDDSELGLEPIKKHA